jgi:hypothetical protein
MTATSGRGSVGAPWHLALSPDGETLALLDEDAILMWLLAPGEDEDDAYADPGVYRSTYHDAYAPGRIPVGSDTRPDLRRIVWCPDSQSIIMATSDGVLCHWRPGAPALSTFHVPDAKRGVKAVAKLIFTSLAVPFELVAIHGDGSARCFSVGDSAQVRWRFVSIL